VHQFTGSLNVTNSINLNGKAIYSNKAGTVAPGAFGGIPFRYAVIFSQAFPNNDYAVTVTGGDLRTWTIENKGVGGFNINTNSNVALVEDTYWIAVPHNS
jgi:hypothetical protein